MKLFINYRRVDSIDITGRIYDSLVRAFGKENIYKDVDSISLGEDFREKINSLLRQSDFLLVVIGQHWLDCRNNDGERRIDASLDYVRLEIEISLQKQIPIIPLFVKGSQMPDDEKLPASIRELAYRNGIDVRYDPDFHRDMEQLITKLQEKGMSESIDEIVTSQDVLGQLTRKDVLKIIESTRSQGKKPDFRNAKLVEIDLSGENLSGVDFTKANLSSADLEQGNLENASLQRANLDNVNLYRAHMKNANLRRASMKNTNLYKPTLTNADLSEVDLKVAKVDFDGAYLDYAKLYDADLSNIDLSRTILVGAEYSNSTIWPDGFDPKKAGAILR